jgi:hypothetical protein
MTFFWHRSGAIVGKLDRENWYWCGQTRQGPLWEYLGEPGPNPLHARHEAQAQANAQRAIRRPGAS